MKSSQKKLEKSDLAIQTNGFLNFWMESIPKIDNVCDQSQSSKKKKEENINQVMEQNFPKRITLKTDVYIQQNELNKVRKKNIFQIQPSNVFNESNTSKSKNITDKNWPSEEERFLINSINTTDINNLRKVSTSYNNKNPEQCLYSYNKLEKINSKKWSRREDILLLELVDSIGKNWELISIKMEGRHPNEIQERYENKLDPNLNRSNFEKEEDRKILILYSQYGNKWKEISKFFPGRNADMIKSRFYACLRKKIIYNTVCPRYSKEPSIEEHNLMPSQNNISTKTFSPNNENNLKLLAQDSNIHENEELHSIDPYDGNFLPRVHQNFLEEGKDSIKSYENNQDSEGTFGNFRKFLNFEVDNSTATFSKNKMELDLNGIHSYDNTFFNNYIYNTSDNIINYNNDFNESYQKAFKTSSFNFEENDNESMYHSKAYDNYLYIKSFNSNNIEVSSKDINYKYDNENLISQYQTLELVFQKLKDISTKSEITVPHNNDPEKLKQFNLYQLLIEQRDKLLLKLQKLKNIHLILNSETQFQTIRSSLIEQIEIFIELIKKTKLIIDLRQKYRNSSKNPTFSNDKTKSKIH